MSRLIVRPQLRHGGLVLPRTGWDKSKMCQISGFVGKGKADMWTICNQYNEPVQVCIGWVNEDACTSVNPEAPWMFSGWYSIQPMACANVLDANLAELGPNLLYYAESASGAWPGTISIPVPDKRFTRCFGTTAPDDVSLNFAVLPVGNSEDFTLNLTE